MPGQVLRETFSVCPVCLKRIPARREREGREVHLRKTCTEHGPFSAILWRGHADLDGWTGPEGAPDAEPPCPDACGLCPGHRQQTCCVLLEVTRRCNLECRFCFADGGGVEPSFAQLEASLRQLADPGRTLVQLSGASPPCGMTCQTWWPRPSGRAANTCS